MSQVIARGPSFWEEGWRGGAPTRVNSSLGLDSQP